MHEGAPTAASGRISRGNHTLPTSEALPTIDWHADPSEVEKRFHGSSPANMKMAKSGIPAFSTSWKTT